MEEDIKILEEYIDFQKQWKLLNHEKALITAIENLIKGYRELEEQIDKHVYFETTNPKEIEKNFIPKSKIKEKLEGLEKEKDETYTKFLGCNRSNDTLSTKGKMLEGAIQVLQELLGDEK